MVDMDPKYRRLFEAAQSGDLKGVQESLCECDINKEDRMGWTPLGYAVHNCHDDVAKYLVEKGADVNNTSISISFLMDVAQKGDLDMVKFLVENDANVNLEDDMGKTALIYAAANGHFEIVKYLVEHGADIYHEDEGECDACGRAIQNGHEEIGNYLSDVWWGNVFD